jgi:hypothetical protein
MESLSWWMFVLSVPNSSLQSSAVRVSPQDVAAARMSAACGNVRAVVATSALATRPPGHSFDDVERGIVVVVNDIDW